MQRLSQFLIGASTFFFLIGCATYKKQTDEMRSFYRSSSYDAALQSLEKSSVATSAGDRLVYLLEKAMIYDRLGQSKKARQALLEADALADKLYTVSVSNSATSYIVNDAAGNYSGEDYEKVAIHIQVALSFIGEGKLDSALVAARKINSKLNELNSGYGDSSSSYKEDALARYLAGIVYEAKDRFDSAIIDYRKALALYEADGHATFAPEGTPDGLLSALYRLYGKRNRRTDAAKLKKAYSNRPELFKDSKNSETSSELVVIHEIGQITPKKSESFFVKAGSQAVRVSFPIIPNFAARNYNATGFSLNGGPLIGADLVQDMNGIARTSLSDKRARITVKSAARLLLKGQIAEQARQQLGPLGELAANVYSLATEVADTRGWTLLPEGYAVSRQRLKPGAYQVEVKTSGRTTEVRKVTLRPNQTVILRSAS